MGRNCTCYDGLDYNHFIAETFGECLYSGREIASFIVGMSSLGFWIACQVPQFLKNYEKKSASALSKWFLLEWFMGDALNLVGALLTHQLATQLATAFLFIMNDSLMILQMSYYAVYGEKIRHRRTQTNESVSSQISNPRLTQVALAAIAIPAYSLALKTTNKIGNPMEMEFVSIDQAILHGNKIPNCEPTAHIDKASQHIGVIIGWISAAVYLNSRIPQIIKNHNRKSVEGLSFLMFFCAVMGNTTYGLGVLLRDSSPAAINKALPWLVGSLGTLILDFTILVQFWYYGEEDDEDGDDVDTNEYTRLSLDNIDETSEENIGQQGNESDEDEEESSDLFQRFFGSFGSKSPQRGIFGIRAWNTSPFFKPRRASAHQARPPPLNLRDTTSLGVLPSEQMQRVEETSHLTSIMRRNVSQSDDFAVPRERSGST